MLWHRLLAGQSGPGGAGIGQQRTKPVRFSRYQFFVYTGPEDAGASLPIVPRFARAVPAHYAGISCAAAGISPAHAGTLFAAALRLWPGLPGGLRAFDDRRGSHSLPADCALPLAASRHRLRVLYRGGELGNGPGPL